MSIFKSFFIYFMFVFLFPAFSTDHSTFNFELIQILPFADSDRSLINSVAFHPESRLFCVTFSHNNKVIIYEIDSFGQSKIFQILDGLNSELSFPTSAVFSHDGKSLIVANYESSNFTIYPLQNDGLYQNFPSQRCPFTQKFRPHGMKISPDGNYLAVAYCSYHKNPKAIELYKINHLESNEVTLKRISLLQHEEINTAVPKGVTFSPDGSCLLVTFSRNNSIAVYEIDWEREIIIYPPKQILNGQDSLVSRPEDVQFLPDSDSFAITNSDKDTLTFYDYDNSSNTITSISPVYVLKEPRADFSFPHGLSFSPDRKYLVVTQFGESPMELNKKTKLKKDRKDAVLIFKIN